MEQAVYRCAWARNHALEMQYHDTEWGVPVTDDKRLFELLTLESAQSGLSWRTILQKREGYQLAFDDFDMVKVAAYDEHKVAALLDDKRIVRHKQKILATINNAGCVLRLQAEYGSFATFLWQFVNNQPIVNGWASEKDVPASTDLSDLLSQRLKQKGFKFIGTTTCYAFMQAVGMVNDHVVQCHRYSLSNTFC